MESLASISYARLGAYFPLIDLNDATTALHASSHDGVVAYFTIPYSTSMTLTSSLNPSYYGESVSFTATVTSSGGTPTDAVTFYDGATKLGTGTLSSGSRPLIPPAPLTVGSHTIKAVYGGSSSFESSSASLTHKVVLSLLASNTALTCSPNPAAYGVTVTCTATVTGSSNTPTGTVTFYDGSTTCRNSHVELRCGYLFDQHAQCRLALDHRRLHGNRALRNKHLKRGG